MSVPPNYSVPPERPPTPDYGFQPQHGGPTAPEDPKPRNYALIGGIVVGCTVLGLGTILLLALGLTRGGEEADPPAAAAETTSAAEEEATTPQAEETTTEAADDEIGRCLIREPAIIGDGLELLDSCEDPEAFWTITNMSYDVDADVDDEGGLADTQVAYDLCGEEYGAARLGETWTNWHWVYSSGTVDSLYCIEAIGNPDDEGRLPYTPDTDDCFPDAAEWWIVPCDSDLAAYEVTDTIEFDEPRELDDDEATAEAACDSDFYWKVVDVEDRTTAILCGNER
ncbi:hypothetical protein L0U85_01330 [Glycomyces sp. L485]|uniref:hypothetical protein n=1 Tax=Glycomyces sp. L485 TaxID=2909235 RepID=UPI001F4A8956|nr:hypothetical protein [Glycomyces sp. L485]MCH7229509.1 hypothetical protein [Glycomyces sp. L485]